MEDSKRIQIDFRCGITPFSLLKVVHTLHGLAGGEVLEIQGNDPEMQQGLFEVLDPQSVEVLDVRQEEEGYRIRLRKTVEKIREKGELHGENGY